MRLETNRLILRNWQKNDVDDLVEGLNNWLFWEYSGKARKMLVSGDGNHRFDEPIL